MVLGTEQAIKHLQNKLINHHVPFGKNGVQRGSDLPNITQPGKQKADTGPSEFCCQVSSFLQLAQCSGKPDPSTAGAPSFLRRLPNCGGGGSQPASGKQELCSLRPLQQQFPHPLLPCQEFAAQGGQ